MNLYEAIKNNFVDYKGRLKRFLKDVYGEYGKDYTLIDNVNGSTDLDSILDSVVSSYIDEHTSDDIGFFFQGILNDPHGLFEIKTDLKESVITADDLTADVKRDLAIEPGSDEEYELDNLYALRDLDAWIEDLYDDGESREEIKNKFAIEDIALHYGMSEEELDSKVNEVCSKVDKLWDDHEKFMQSLRDKKEADEIEVHTMDNDPSWAAAVNKVNKEYSKNKSKISDDIAKEYARFTKKLTSSGLFKPEDVWELPEGKAYRDAIKDPEDIWCKCSGDTDSKFKPDGTSYLGVSKHGYICNKCKKFTQIG